MATRVQAPASPLKHWSAWLPIAISVFLIALALRYIALTGPGAQADEGTEAHLFQLLMPVRRWSSRCSRTRGWSPRLALGVLAVQLAAASVVFGLVYWLEHA